MVDGDHFALLTTNRDDDDLLEEAATRSGFDCHRGSDIDVLQRTVDALDRFGSSAFVRVNGDSPFFEPSLVNFSLDFIEECSLVTNLLHRSFPYGVAVEIINSKYFREKQMSALESDREHVTRHLYRNLPARFMSLQAYPPTLEHQLAVDTVEDLSRIGRLVESHSPRETYWTALGYAPPTLRWVDQLGRVQRVRQLSSFEL